MKTKLIYLCLIVVFCVGAFLLGSRVYPLNPAVIPIENFKIETINTASISLNKRKLKILSNGFWHGFNRNFVFLDVDTGETVTTLSVASLGLWIPYYEIVKGDIHDWLIVTKLSTWGTGLRYEIAEWYVLGRQERMKMVLTYPSTSFKNETENGINNYFLADIMKTDYLDDLAVDIKFTQKTCSVGSDGYDTDDCSESSEIIHYVWDNVTERFTSE